MAKIYQPQTKEGMLPEGLYSWQVFKTREQAWHWLTEHADPTQQYDIIEYDETDIEDFSFVRMTESIFYLYCGWEEKHKGSSDPTTHGCSVLYSFNDKERAQEFMPIEIEITKDEIKEDIESFGYEFDEDCLSEVRGLNNCTLTYETEFVLLTYNLFIQEGEMFV